MHAQLIGLYTYKFEHVFAVGHRPGLAVSLPGVQNKRQAWYA